jgi:hypothetical protein
MTVRRDFYEHARARVVMDDDAICIKCNKKIGQSAFARYPDGQLMHYVCFTIQH